MARKPGIKSQAVRAYLTEHPEATTNAVLAALAEKGMKATNALVYKVKGAMAERKHHKQRIAKAALAATQPSTPKNVVSVKADAITMIREVKALAAKAGGYEKLKELVDALAE